MEINLTNVRKEYAPDEPKEIKNIRSELAKMDMGFWMAILNKATFHHKEFTKNKTADHEYLEEIQGLEFQIAETRYKGYERIIDKPAQIQMVRDKVKAEIVELEEKKKVLLRIVNGRQGVI